ncbi:hypothetical protein BN2476_220002 [Paraburkholderia piptadeniae]|uniref:Uncharacterized protein n=1 Tax=Paraburkholderia piptadeniae TaxID=1701573 RepID=A0A1N7RWB9_9BURK|nr:hypothetical protein BN2476_220002 [Paraburkholderia piptadeniae]
MTPASRWASSPSIAMSYEAIFLSDWDERIKPFVAKARRLRAQGRPRGRARISAQRAAAGIVNLPTAR